MLNAPPTIDVPFLGPNNQELLNNLLGYAQQNPGWLFAAIVLLPGMGFPASPLLILAGIVWGTNAEGCAIAIAATALNQAWTHQIAAGPAHSIIGKLFGARIQRWGLLGKKNPFRLTTIIRVTPGIPLCVQNYSLGVLRVPFLPYMTLSILLSSIFTCGFVIAGGAVLTGNWTFALGGIAAILAGSLVFKSLRHRIGSVPTQKL